MFSFDDVTMGGLIYIRAVTSNRVISLGEISHGNRLQFFETVKRCSKGPVQ